jgi:hypothetical protein
MEQILMTVWIILLFIILAGYVVAAVITWRMVLDFRRWFRRIRASRKFFKSIERFRRDFK